MATCTCDCCNPDTPTTLNYTTKEINQILGDGVGISNGGNQLLGKNTSGDVEIGDGTLGIDLKGDLVHRVDGDQRYLVYDEDILPNPLHELATVTDLNNATERGTYSFNPGVTNAPSVMTSYGWVLVMVNQTDKGKKTQICGGFDNNGNYQGLYTRYLPDNVNWSSWVNILDLNEFNPDDYLPKTTPTINTGTVIDGLSNVGNRPFLRFHIPGVNYSQFVMDENGTVNLLNGSEQTPGTYKAFGAGPIFSNGSQVWSKASLPMGDTKITDLNSATTRGIYSFDPGVLNGPTGVSSYGIVQVFASEGSKSNVIQQVSGFTSNLTFAGVFVRARLDLNTWSNWNSITMTTQSGGGSN